MKRIEAVIRPVKVADVVEALEKLGHPGMMITEIEGHGKQLGLQQEVRGKKYRVDFIPKARIEIIVRDPDVDKTVKTILDAAHTGEIGDGKIFIHSVENAIRVRTRESGEIAV